MCLITVQSNFLFLLWYFSHLTLLRNCEKHGSFIYILYNLKMMEFSPGLTLLMWISKMSLYSPVLPYMLSSQVLTFLSFFHQSNIKAFLCPSHHPTCLRYSLRQRIYLISLSSNQYLNKNFPKLD